MAEILSTIQLLGRVAIIEQDHILIAHQTGSSNTFLPGGHVEFGEGVTAAMLREACEEFGGELEVGDFIGILEHAYTDLGREFHEINFVFAGKLHTPRFPQRVHSLEGHLEFFWQPLVLLDQINLLPSAIISLIQDYIGNQKRGVWMSTMV